MNLSLSQNYLIRFSSKVLFLATLLTLQTFTPVLAADPQAPKLFEMTSVVGARSGNVASNRLHLKRQTINQFLEGDVKAITVAYAGRDVVFYQAHSSLSLSGVLSWVGKDQSNKTEIILTLAKDHLYGKIHGDSGELNFQPSDQPYEMIRFQQDIKKEVELNHDSVVPNVIAPKQDRVANGERVAAGGADDDGSVIDVMMLYTHGMAAAHPGGLIDTRIQHLIDLANTSFTNSHVHTQIRLVHSKQVNYVDDSPGGMGEALDDLSQNNGVFSDVERLRNNYGADQVTLLRRYVDEGCGRAWLIEGQGAAYAYSVIQDGNKTDGLGGYCHEMSFAHEFGHNFGATHNRENAAMAGVYDYSYGYRDPAVPFRTVMSYSCVGVNCPRIAHYSNPNILYQNVATGIAEGQANSADNAKTFNLRRAIFANYKPSVEFNGFLDRGALAKYVLDAKYAAGLFLAVASGRVFDDVATGSYNADWIEAFSGSGLTEGCSASKFCPREVVTKEQLAKILLKAKHGRDYVPPAATGAVFSDISVNSFSANWIEALSNQGISTGCGNGRFCPHSVVTLKEFFGLLDKVFP